MRGKAILAGSSQNIIENQLKLRYLWVGHDNLEVVIFTQNTSSAYPFSPS